MFFALPKFGKSPDLFMHDVENLLKMSGGLIAVGTVIYLAGKVQQIVDFLRESVEILREEAKTFRETLVDHGERLIVIETQSKIKRRKK